jgi:hypothetical protein
MKQSLLLITISIFFTHWVNGQDAVAGKSVDPQFIQEANVILKKYTSQIQTDAISYPYPWMEDVKEIQNIKRNKVKTINTLMFRSEYDRNGGLVLEQTFKEIQFANQRKTPGSKDEFKRNENGRITLRQSTNIGNPSDVHKREFYYAGDTLYSKWTVNGVTKALGLGYQNILIDKYLTGSINTIYVYKKELLSNGYLLTELMMSGREKRFKEINKFKFNSEGLMVEYVSSVIKEEYLYNSNGLIIERKLYFQERLTGRFQFIRNDEGLVSEYIEWREESKPEVRIPYEYEYYD